MSSAHIRCKSCTMAFLPVHSSFLANGAASVTSRMSLFTCCMKKPSSPHSVLPKSARVNPRITMVAEPSSMLKQPSVIVSQDRREELAKIITEGPVFQSGGLELQTLHGCTTDLNGTCLDDWVQLGAMLESELGSFANDCRVYQYYLPIYFWILRELDVHKTRREGLGKSPRPFILGFCCPQGGGKTTMTTFLEKLLRAAGRTCQIASLDDFYVTNADQRAIAAKNADNRLLQYRGMPGTHDLPLLNETLDLLRKGEEVSIPRYDKTAFGGRGDRMPRENWKHLGGGAVDVVLLEGWCLGYEPVPVDTLIDEDLLLVNDALASFVSLYARIDGMFLIEISNMQWVYEWRLQAERASRAAGKPGLTDDQVIDFVSRFMPAYQQYSTPLYNRKTPIFPRPELHIEIDEDRKPVHRKR